MYQREFYLLSTMLNGTISTYPISENLMEGLEFSAYDEIAISHVLAEHADNFDVYTLGLSAKVGEFQHMLKKNKLNQLKHNKDKFSQKEMAYGLGDALWYITALADLLGYRLEDIAYMNLDTISGGYEVE